MPTDHVEQLFSAAFDEELSAGEAERFHQHLAACAVCREAFDRFRATVAAVRGLPQARMPLPVHLPSAEPQGERSRIAAIRGRLSRVRLSPGGATVIAAVAAAVIVVFALNHQQSTITTTHGGGAFVPEAQGASGSNGCNPTA
ncbi:MAG: zf-HC2 domain-containing protein, partial [Candidatus Dormibacteraeota bacterium]|nr:zf-HC2 domain-containing protein [Candidatus Dormibacteraeota bacterium]